MVHHEAKRVTRHLHCRHPRPQNQLPPLPLRQQTLLQRCGLRQGTILGNPSMLAVTREQFNMTPPILEHYHQFFEVQPGFMNSIGQPFRRSRQLIMRHSRVQNAIFVELQATGNCKNGGVFTTPISQGNAPYVRNGSYPKCHESPPQAVAAEFPKKQPVSCSTWEFKHPLSIMWLRAQFLCHQYALPANHRLAADCSKWIQMIVIHSSFRHPNGLFPAKNPLLCNLGMSEIPTCRSTHTEHPSIHYIRYIDICIKYI